MKKLLTLIVLLAIVAVPAHATVFYEDGTTSGDVSISNEGVALVQAPETTEPTLSERIDAREQERVNVRALMDAQDE